MVSGEKSEGGSANSGISTSKLPDRFILVKILGDGAAGVVYHVKDKLRGGQDVALKILTDTKAFDEHTTDRFREELKICQRIRHPNLIEAYELLRINGRLAFSMEYVQGSDLARLFSKKKFSPHQIDIIFDQVLSGLEELHSNGILHRDIKLENVLLRKDGTIKLSDLGLMKQYQKELTAKGVILGTAHYLPPEYVKEGRYDVRSEIYALGTMLYEMLTCQRWLPDMSGAKALEHMIKTKFRFPIESLIDVSAKYRHILDRSLAYKFSDRFQNVSEMKAAFKRDSRSVPIVSNREVIEPKLQFNTSELNLERPLLRSRRVKKIILFLLWTLLVSLTVSVILKELR